MPDYMENKLLIMLKKYLKIKYPKYLCFYFLRKYHLQYFKNNCIKMPKHLTCAESIYFILNNIGLIDDNYHLKVPDDLFNLNTHTFYQ